MEKRDLTGGIGVITGANTGLGFQTSLALSKLGMTIVLACRSQEKARKAINEIHQKYPEANLDFIPLDLADLSSVRNFSKELEQRYSRVDLLVNNAGVMIPPFTKTKDEFELQMGVNYFGHFALTNLLLPLIDKSEKGRIVQVSSIAHQKGKIDFNNLNAEDHFNKFEAYGQSKLACLMLALQLDKKLKLDNSKVVSIAAHPGVSRTELGRYIPKIAYTLLYPFFYLFTHSAEKGAQPIILAATDENAKGGEYYGPTGFNEMVGEPGKAKIFEHAKEEHIQHQLWQVSEAFTETHYPFSSKKSATPNEMAEK